MKQLKSIERMLGGIIASLAFFTAAINSTATCGFIFHQPKMPDCVRGLRRR